MIKIKEYVGKSPKTSEADFFGRFWEKSWTYIKTVVDVVREPVLILDEEFHVLAANDAFYNTFSAELEDTEGKVVYGLGNGQWNIPELRTLLENILPKQTFFKGFQVAHEFPDIGRRVMILNGRQIYVTDEDGKEPHPSIIVLAIEDVTDMMVVAESLRKQSKSIEDRLSSKAQKLEIHIGELEREINDLKNSKTLKK
ncbi:MAG: PAS domain-containing protein [Patescibacteria group bacterium]